MLRLKGAGMTKQNNKDAARDAEQKVKPQNADATAEARDEGIGRYELIRQRNKAEAQRDELLAAIKDAIYDEQIVPAIKFSVWPKLRRLQKAIANAERGSK